ncbi:MAG TPA: nitroreductase family deazaflavin-dependent oxidoreductase [Lapillicoccus sp.]|nr:nitroreductase family deazaflavin-dependent oxidoreductase [Lapillicoccus sp.]
MGAHHSKWPAKRMEMTTGRRIGNALMQRLVSWNLVPRAVMLTTVGRRTGETRRTPVTLIHRSKHLYLVAPYGPVGWVWNARAAGTVRITGKVDGATTDTEYAAREVSELEAGPVLKDYWETAPTVRSYFSVPKGAPVEAFVREAHCHPVFELTPVTPG